MHQSIYRFRHIELASESEEAAAAVAIVLAHNIGFGASCYWHIASYAAEHVTDAAFMISHELNPIL